MEEIINTIVNVINTLDNLNLRGRITQNAAAYNEIIACINSLAEVHAKLNQEAENAENQAE